MGLDPLDKDLLPQTEDKKQFNFKTLIFLMDLTLLGICLVLSGLLSALGLALLLIGGFGYSAYSAIGLFRFGAKGKQIAFFLPALVVPLFLIQGYISQAAWVEGGATIILYAFALGIAFMIAYMLS